MPPASSPPTAHVDTFCAQRLPPPHLWPEFPGIDGYPAQLNAADFLLSGVRGRPLGGPDVAAGGVAYRRGDDVWTYGQLDDRVRRMAGAFHSLGLVPGNRVLLRGFNSPELAAAILACLHAGLVAVPTMPLLRAAELDAIATTADVSRVVTDERLVVEVRAMGHDAPVSTWGPSGDLDPSHLTDEPAPSVATAATDVALLLFTSGTTGTPKAACHFHRNIAAICDTAGVDIYRLGPDDVLTGTPPLAFAYGFGAFCAFPLRVGASTVLLEQPTPSDLLDTIERHRVTVTFTAPTAYRALLPLLDGRDLSSLRYGASAGETLPAPTYEAFLEATGAPLLDGIGSTELLHIFCSNRIDDHRPGLTGTDIAGYHNRVVDNDGNPVADGEIGHLEVRGPTGCLYLDDERQEVYVRDGWNRTGDLYVRDADGWFAYQSRADDLIVTSGYNVAGPEVEAALLSHPAVAECAVIGVPDPARGHVVKAIVVPTDGAVADDQLAAALQDHVKATIAPYKYPRLIEFRADLPKTGTGKVQRFVLRQQEATEAAGDA